MWPPLFKWNPQRSLTKNNSIRHFLRSNNKTSPSSPEKRPYRSSAQAGYYDPYSRLLLCCDLLWKGAKVKRCLCCYITYRTVTYIFQPTASHFLLSFFSRINEVALKYIISFWAEYKHSIKQHKMEILEYSAWVNVPNLFPPLREW